MSSLDLADASSCVSIGAGCGDIDSVLLEKAMPKLTYYCGVEPSYSMMKPLQESIEPIVGRRNIRTDYFIEKGQEWLLNI